MLRRTRVLFEQPIVSRRIPVQLSIRACAPVSSNPNPARHRAPLRARGQGSPSVSLTSRRQDLTRPDLLGPDPSALLSSRHDPGRIERIGVSGRVVVEARDVDRRHRSVGGHGSERRELLQPGERSLRWEGVGVAAEERVLAVKAAEPVQ